METVVSVGIKHSIVANHVKSTEHAESKKWLLQKKAWEVDVAEATKQYDNVTYCKGEILPEQEYAWEMEAFFESRSASS